jgi:hypothetical protein
MTGTALLLLSFPVAIWVLASVPAFVVGQRLGVVHAGEAFIPVVGPSIVLLHSIRRSGWICILGVVPYVGFFFFIWLVCVIPGAHMRTKWWILAFLVPGANVVAFYVYAFTLPPRMHPGGSALAPS